MADEELTDDDWLEVYEHLLEQLSNRGFTDFRRELEAAATTPVFEEGSVDEEERILKEYKGEVGHQSQRQRQPSEVFEGALHVIWTRLVEFPLVAAAMANKLKIEDRQIEFRVDYESQYAPQRSEPISLARLRLTESEITEISKALEAVGLPADVNHSV